MNISVFLLVTLLPYMTMQASVQVGIVNGTEAKPHSRPYMVSIQINKIHRCGGFLVSEQFVMTAAHCFQKEAKLTVVVGAHDYTQGSGLMDVKFYHIHPGYTPETLLNDIMLLQLYGKVKKNKKVNWISIPKKDKDIKAKIKCSVAGWGKTHNSGEASTKLMEVDVTITDKKVCQKQWGKNYSTSRMVCAGGPGGFCQGDSGGPLVCDNVAVGVVSFNEKNNCDSPIRPNVYTKISKFLKWINATLDGVKLWWSHQNLIKMSAAYSLLLSVALMSLLSTGTFGADIINGKKAKKNSMQYMASVQIEGEHICGGFLIHPSYVLTAAHCDQSGNMTVILGTHNIAPKVADPKRHAVQKKHKHPSFKNIQSGNDIMLLKLSKKLKNGKGVKTIEIQKKDKGINPKTQCKVAGWGKTGQKNMVNDLLVTNVLVFNSTVCRTMWNKVQNKFPINVLCAGGYNTKSGACQGDSGGPLVCSGKAVGIVSFNRLNNCDYPDVPNVYTDIYKYKTWIEEVIKRSA
ncbi:transmembrane protease serine 9-like [Puntigrus tetrazona]|uniref:transmembrane protease serine 9-like n=1 Tax=Puntigrus tetrazona TaxID=1606681 RepID=UPI001C8A2971|nr:transmembrane protease serine 9-like [Puntigrus tetrazona]